MILGIFRGQGSRKLSLGRCELSMELVSMWVGFGHHVGAVEGLLLRSKQGGWRRELRARYWFELPSSSM